MTWRQTLGKAFDRRPNRRTLRKITDWWSENVYTDAFSEFLTVFFLSNLPFCFLVLTHYIATDGTTVSWDTTTKIISKNWKPGEILILVSALLAPFPFLLASYHRVRRHMPGYLFLFLTLLLMFLFSSYIFAADRLSAIKNENFVRTSSLILYLFALIISYYGLVFQRKLIKPPSDNSSDRADQIAAQLQQGEP